MLLITVFLEIVNHNCVARRKLVPRSLFALHI